MNRLVAAAAILATSIAVSSVCAGDIAFSQRTVAGLAPGVESTHAADLDGDGDVDVVGALHAADTIAWYENSGGSPPTFAEHVISTTTTGATAVFATDVDGDGHVDVLAASADHDSVIWFKNDGGSPPTFALQPAITIDPDAPAFRCGGIGAPCQSDGGCPVTETCDPDAANGPLQGLADGVNALAAVDVDRDGDIDVLSTSYNGNASPPDSKVVWYEQCPCDGSLRGTLADNESDSGSDTTCGGTDTRDEWFLYRSTCMGTATATTCSAGTNFDTVLAVFSANAATELACNNDAPGPFDPQCETTPSGFNRGSIVQWPVASGARYLVRVSAFNDDVVAGDFELTIHCDDGSGPPAFLPHVIHEILPPGEDFGLGSSALDVRDIDGDGDVDVAVTSTEDRALVWYENGVTTAGGEEPIEARRFGRPFTQHLVLEGAGALSFGVAVAPIDGDGDLDIVSASSFDLSIAWFGNGGGPVPLFTEQFISDAALTSFDLVAADLDLDGDIDVVAGSVAGLSPEISGGGLVHWFENLGGTPAVFASTPRLIADDVDYPRDVFTVDLDGDGDTDVLAASTRDGRIAWYDSALAPPVVNKTTGEFFATVASAIAAAADGHVLSAHPMRFLAEPDLDLGNKALTLVARGGITQPLGGLYTLADGARLRAAAGWDLHVEGRLVAPPGASAHLECRRLTLAVGGELATDLSADLFVSAGGMLEGPTTLAAGSSLTLRGDVAVGSAGSAALGAGAGLFVMGDLTLDGPASLHAGAVLAGQESITSRSDVKLLGGVISAIDLILDDGSLMGFGTIDADVDNRADASLLADTQVVGDYTNGSLYGRCDDGGLMRTACVTDSDCPAGPCVEIGTPFGLCDDVDPTT